MNLCYVSRNKEKDVRKVSFISSLSTLGSIIVVFINVILCHSLHVEAQFNPAFLQEHNFLNDSLQP